MKYTELLRDVEELILRDRLHLRDERDITAVLQQFDAFHDEAPRSYLGYRYRLRVATDHPQGWELSPAAVLRFISMTVNDGKTLGQHLRKKYGPFELADFDVKTAYTQEAVLLIQSVTSPLADLTETEAGSVDHLENMTAIRLAGKYTDAFKMHDDVAEAALTQLKLLGAATERATATHELAGPLLSDRKYNATQARKRVRTQFIDLRDGRYDFLLPYEDSLRQAVTDLEQERIDFEVLPPGTDLCTHARRAHRRSSPGSAARVAVEKLRVLEDLRRYFGHERCRLLCGTASSRRFLGQSETNINGSYYVLVVACTDRSGRPTGHDAIALSPLTGHATFYVRHDAVAHHWKEIFSYPKRDAKAMGARRLRLAGPAGWDPATALRERLIALAGCSPQQFRTGAPTPVPGTHKYTII
ncbi:hypothetical protein ACFYSW_27730 [Rhodococcus aetherivorans]|uniref:hypothetical protein n=1 Tax=Rhodococcus aetherivorans TaxID=191292 RepID=UPI0036CA6EF7